MPAVSDASKHRTSGDKVFLVTGATGTGRNGR